MAEVRVEIRGQGIPEADQHELALRLVESYTATIGEGLRSEVDILIGHRPMVFGGELSDEERVILAAAVLGAFVQILGKPPEATQRVQVRFIIEPQTRREHFLKQIVELSTALADHQAAQERLGEIPARQQEIERLQAEIRRLEAQLEQSSD